MDLEYDYLGDVQSFDYDNVESVMKSLVATGDSTCNDSQEVQSDVELDAIPNNLNDTKSNKKKTVIDTVPKISRRTSTRSQTKNNNTKNNNTENIIIEHGNSKDEDESSDEELNTELFSILNKPSNSKNLTITNTQKGRARRSYYAKLAENMPNKDFVDLTDLTKNKKKPVLRPRQRNPNVIVIGSDDEYDNIDLPPISINVADSKINKRHSDIDSENPECKIKLQWRAKIEIHLLRKFQKFDDLIKVLADREKCNHEDILLNLNSTIISSTDSPDSISYKISDIIHGRVVKNSNNASTRQKNNNELQIKIIAKEWKRPIVIFINKNDSVSILYIKVSEEIKTTTDKFMLMFDGDVLSTNSRIEDLELEGGEIIELTFKK